MDASKNSSLFFVDDDDRWMGEDQVNANDLLRIKSNKEKSRQRKSRFRSKPRPIAFTMSLAQSLTSNQLRRLNLMKRLEHRDGGETVEDLLRAFQRNHSCTDVYMGP